MFDWEFVKIKIMNKIRPLSLDLKCSIFPGIATDLYGPNVTLYCLAELGNFDGDRRSCGCKA